jgi:hypothetical protein
MLLVIIFLLPNGTQVPPVESLRYPQLLFAQNPRTRQRPHANLLANPPAVYIRIQRELFHRQILFQREPLTIRWYCLMIILWTPILFLKFLQIPSEITTRILVGHGVMLKITSKARQKSDASLLMMKNMTSLSPPSVNGINLFLSLLIEATFRPSAILNNVFKNLFLQNATYYRTVGPAIPIAFIKYILTSPLIEGI